MERGSSLGWQMKLWLTWLQVDLRRLPPREKKRVEAETQILKRLQHPNIIRIFDTWDNPKRDQVLVWWCGGVVAPACLSEPCCPHQVCFITEIVTSGTLRK